MNLFLFSYSITEFDFLPWLGFCCLVPRVNKCLLPVGGGVHNCNKTITTTKRHPLSVSITVISMWPDLFRNVEECFSLTKYKQKVKNFQLIYPFSFHTLKNRCHYQKKHRLVTVGILKKRTIFYFWICVLKVLYWVATKLEIFNRCFRNSISPPNKVEILKPSQNI